nr:histidinol-phosphatase HisJ [Alkalicoccus daliensis]
MKRDGHIHTPYCPHGSADSLDAYVQQALNTGLTDITFTEHAPLPGGFIDPVPEKDSAMRAEDLLPYIEAVRSLQSHYEDQIRIRIGLEVDFIEGYEKETKEFLNAIGPQIDDAILSVHFLKTKDGYWCLDYHEDTFHKLISSAGSLKKVYQLYYETVIQSVQADLGRFKPERVGHMTLVHKFQKLFPADFNDSYFIDEVLQEVQKNNMSLDVNTAGLLKKHCREHYPPAGTLKKAQALHIPFVYGSDAHASSGVGGEREKVADYF